MMIRMFVVAVLVGFEVEPLVMMIMMMVVVVVVR